MHQYTARDAVGADLRNFVEWLHANRGLNNYDPTIFGYTSTQIIAVDKDGETICFLPYQVTIMDDKETIMTESLAPKPGLTRAEVAKALETAIHEVARRAKAKGIGEIYFLSDQKDVATRAFAKVHGYDELTLKVMRLRLKDMVPPLPEDAKEK